MPLANMQRGYCSWCGVSTLVDLPKEKEDAA